MTSSIDSPPSSLSHSSLDMMVSNGDNRTDQEAVLQAGFDDSSQNHPSTLSRRLPELQTTSSSFASKFVDVVTTDSLLNGIADDGVEDRKGRRCHNMTECVPVPTSEHVAEIVGRQGSKIKALRVKTNTYIKTPARGEEPVFVVTGRKEDVAAAKREILSAADHFTQIRASRKKNINSTLALGQMMADTPGQTTVQVRVPYKVVGLVVGPKGTTIKRIQQRTHTYIVTPTRDKEPVFEVTGLPENVDAARKEIESHINLRTRNGQSSPGPMDSSRFLGEDDDDVHRMAGNSSNGFGSSGFDRADDVNNGNLSSIFSSRDLVDSPCPSLTAGSNSVSSGGQAAVTLGSFLDRNHYDLSLGERSDGSFVPWSHRGSHDSGIGSSPPLEDANTNGYVNSIHSSQTSSFNGIWGELSRAVGSLNLSSNENTFLHVGSSSSLDFGGTWGYGYGSSSATSSSSASPAILLSTANDRLSNLGANGHHIGVAGEFLPSSAATDPSPPISLPFVIQDEASYVLDQVVFHALESEESNLPSAPDDNAAALVSDTATFCYNPNR